MTTLPYKIILADDNRFFTEALKKFLESEDEFKVLATCNTIKETIANTNSCCFDLLVLDLSFSGINSINYLNEIRPDASKFKILCLSSFDNSILQKEVINAGIEFVVSKHDSIEDFPEIIKKVICSNGNSETNNEEKSTEKITLSTRQIEIIKACFEHSTEKDIAGSLNISVNTLKSHKQKIFNITNSKNNIELIKYGIREGILIV